ncbi:PIF / Ping-Pong family of plant transposase [Corchorus olitorius]|uniref:PIF / Ping-Pong family of plant transposase n=1 Tax=Corchorus olitorius TaxID=93759 RepID=A0A1R3GN10_9ROSI|nr:PIF / Ping-Pong family of plant transposase [Corchorus olitorius]
MDSTTSPPISCDFPCSLYSLPFFSPVHLFAPLWVSSEVSSALRTEGKGENASVFGSESGLRLA